MTNHIGFTQLPPTKRSAHRRSAHRRSAEARRIEELGEMNDRRTRYLAAGDALHLRKLAAEYAARGMAAMAREIELEAEGGK